MFRQISAGKVQCLINVVSYGFHGTNPLWETYKQGEWYEEGMSKEVFFRKFLEENRKIELALMKELSHRIKDAKQKIRMITLVTKQDLWWKDKEIVQDFYTTGEYNEIIQEISKKKGEDNFEHTFSSVSLISNNFRIGNEIFYPTVGGYDQSLRISNLDNFISGYNSLLQ